ncbi:MAG: hypothetical protein PVH88_02180 [Ignavibacteria bacterium]|jgi:hypothetical protein
MGDWAKAWMRQGPGVTESIRYLKYLQDQANKKENTKKLNDLFSSSLGNINRINQSINNPTEEITTEGFSDYVLGDIQTTAQKNTAGTNETINFLQKALQVENPDINQAGSMFDILNKFVTPISSQRQKTQKDPYKAGKYIYGRKDDDSIDFSKPIHTIEESDDIKDPYRFSDYVFGRDEDGNVDFSNILFKAPDKTEDEEYPDISTDLGTLQQGIKIVKDIKKTPFVKYSKTDPRFENYPSEETSGEQLLEEIEYLRDKGLSDEEIFAKKGLGNVFNTLDEISDTEDIIQIPEYGGAYFLNDGSKTKGYFTQESFDKYKESVKNKYVDTANKIIYKTGLQDAVEIIREQLKKGRPLDKVLEAFMKGDSSLTKDDADVLRAYFRLMSL